MNFGHLTKQKEKKKDYQHFENVVYAHRKEIDITNHIKTL